MNLEVLNKSKEKKATEPLGEPLDGEPWRKKEKTVKLAAKSVKENISEPEAVQAMPSFAEITQLKEALASCTRQMEHMQKEFEARSQPS